MEKPSISTIIRKPWGMKMPLGKASEAPISQEGDAFWWIAVALKKQAEIFLLACLIAVPLMYHLSFPNDLALKLQEIFSNNYFFNEQLKPFITGSLPTLETKFSVWALLGLFMAAAFFLSKVFESCTVGRVYFESPDKQNSSIRRSHRFFPILFFSGFCIFALLSILFWPPGIPSEAVGLSGADGGESFFAKLGGGGFFYSTVSWLQIIFVLFFFLVAEDMIRERLYVQKILTVIVSVGIINATMVIFQKVEFDPVMKFWIDFSDENARNNLGGFIGHNTGVSSFLITPTLVSIMWMLSIQPRRRKLLRVSLLCGILIMSLAIVLAQSRAVLPIVVACGALMLFFLWKKSCLNLNSRLYIWFPVALAFIVLTQIIPSRFNPLYRRDVTLVERAAEFRPERLLTETRLRILAVSMSELLPESPLIGHGFGSFQYVYPTAQGNYFADPDNRNTLLAPTPLRTQRAHNEYLQILIESGIVGLALLLGGLYFLIAGGLKVLNRTLMPYHIASQLAIIFSIVGILLHAFVDFPLRVPPIALQLVILLAIWSAGDRLWIFPLNPPHDEDDTEEESVRQSLGEKMRTVLPASLGKPGFIHATLYVMGGSLSVVSLGIVVLVSAAAIGPFQSISSLALRSGNLLNFYSSNQSAEVALIQGWNDAHAARRIAWIDGDTNRVNAQAQYFRAIKFYDLADEMAQEGKLESAVKTRNYASTLAETALTDVNMTLTEQNHHGIYWLRHFIHRLLHQNLDGQEKRAHYEAMILDLYKTVNMNPGDFTALISLIDFLERDATRNNSEIVRYMQTLHYFHPEVFDEKIFSKVLDLMWVGFGEEANDRLRRIVEAVPSEDKYARLLPATTLAAGRTEEARRLALRAREMAEETDEGKMQKENATMVLLQVALLNGNRDEAESYLNEASKFQSISRAQYLAYSLFLNEKDSEEYEAIKGEIHQLSKTNHMAPQITGVIALDLARDPEEAVYWLEKRYRDTSSAPPMDMQGLIYYARANRLLGNWALVEKLIPEIRQKEASSFVERIAWNYAARLSEEARRIQG